MLSSKTKLRENLGSLTVGMIPILASMVLRRSWALVGQKIDDREKSNEDIDIDGKSQTAWKYG